ncbi:hypothetical protein LB467_10100 [Salegentibacter sp. JZCK2]|uniref:hypothetical protein n=1 Tax=Salegentibacter tibetensis TaxID=2873600 RepID=UPI001CCD2E40|nr:hypothetical protein [Salegentibacter tibetensis]MBZ9730037.1 hypothetical protein [Salegentibacter tibetensis]
MKNSTQLPIRSIKNVVWLFCLALIFSCEAEPVLQEEINTADLGVKKNHNVVDVVTTHMNIEVQSTIPSGWTTFRYDNRSHNPHFVLIDKLPEGKTVEDSKEEIVPVFQEGMDFIALGDWDSALEAFGKLPAWSGEIIYSGGTGLLSPNQISEITVYLEPGTYVLECYVKDSEGRFHTWEMIAQIEVTEDDSGNKEPKPTMEVRISSEAGIQFDKKVRPGKHLIKAFFEDQTVYSHFLGHDIHLVRLDENANLDELNSWMNWSDPNAFKTPAPEGVEFLGGMQDLPVLDEIPNSNVGYFAAHLKPGTYAFIAEVPDPMSKGMLKVFTVPSSM